ncbi:MAG: hypothetical protein JO092_04705 [Candidatus Eremiobacteraeota bacterium]|nr:hypothetical protein [Candidatus Eremiobacteraeota bacterium]MBV8373900.1 hypothetical protein [Candidatus Eremiobacteraeota bacterium]
MNTARFFMRLGALLAFAGMPAVAGAVQAHLTTTHPVTVTNCNPQRNHYMATGYAPAYYPVGYRYWGWPAVYPGYSYYQYPVQGEPTLSIDYSNATNMVMKDIEFGLVAHRNLVAEVRDVGTFSPGAEIKHSFGLSPNVFPLGTSLVECVPLRITFADGSKWKNPHLPRLNRSIYGKPHS